MAVAALSSYLFPGQAKAGPAFVEDPCLRRDSGRGIRWITWPDETPKKKNSGRTGKFLDAFHYLAQDIIGHPLAVSPQPLAFNMTLVRGGGVVDMGWDTPESAPWIELTTYVRKLTMLDSESTNLSKVLMILGRDYEGIRPDVKQLQDALKEWRGSSKAQLLTQAEDGDSLSVTSNAEAAEIVINGYLFHANADLLKAWRKMDPFAQTYCLSSAQDWVTTAAGLVKEAATLIEVVMPELVPAGSQT